MGIGRFDLAPTRIQMSRRINKVCSGRHADIRNYRTDLRAALQGHLPPPGPAQLIAHPACIGDRNAVEPGRTALPLLEGGLKKHVGAPPGSALRQKNGSHSL